MTEATAVPGIPLLSAKVLCYLTEVYLKLSFVSRFNTLLLGCFDAIRLPTNGFTAKTGEYNLAFMRADTNRFCVPIGAALLAETVTKQFGHRDLVSRLDLSCELDIAFCEFRSKLGLLEEDDDAFFSNLLPHLLFGTPHYE